MANEIAKKENTELTYNEGIDLASVFAEEMDGLTPTFERIKIPSGGGISFEVPGDDPENPDSVKEFKAVILYHHPINCYYKEEYTGGNNPPDSGSMDGHVGIDAESGEVKNCAECPFNKFGILALYHESARQREKEQCGRDAVFAQESPEQWWHQLQSGGIRSRSFAHARGDDERQSHDRAGQGTCEQSRCA